MTVQGPIFKEFCQRAATHPREPALVSKDGICTYSELDAISNRLAGYLANTKIGRGHVVALYAKRNPALIYAILAVLKAGASFFIADAEYPLGRFLDCTTLVKPSLLIVCGDADIPEETASRFQTLHLSSSKSSALKMFSNEKCELSHDWSAEDIAYISFTSGSTGKPKGISTTHTPLIHFIEWHAKQHQLTQHDHFSFLSGLSHDPALRDIFTPLSIGAALHIPEQSILFNPMHLSNWISQQGITVIHLTPSLGEIIVSSGTNGPPLNRIRYFFWGGDVLNARLSKKIKEVASNSRQINFYGTTETPQAMSHFTVDPTMTSTQSYPIGKGIDGVQLLIIKENGKRADVNEIGEIYIRTPYLSNGYIDDPEQTKSHFVANPLSGDPLDRCYKTGDLGKYLSNGDVLFLGRSDHQIKIRGFRVELDEIILKIEQVPGIARAIVLANSQNRDSKVLIAFYVCEQGQNVTNQEVKDSLKNVLPSYMVPSYIVKVDQFPLFPNGKIDLTALISRKISEREFEPPKTERERQLVKIWQEILNVDNVGIHDSFADLGGDSLSAIQALIAMQRFGIPEKLASGVLQGKTISQIVKEEQGASSFVSESLSDSGKTSLVINLLRCILITIVVVDHWFPGLLNRLPSGFHSLQPILSPLFNIATPGFAFIFGIGLGYNYFSDYLVQPARIRKRLHLGVWLLGISVLISSLLNLAVLMVKKQILTSTLIFDAPYGPLLYYFIALLTVPAWFWFISRFSSKMKSTLALMVIFYFTYLLCLFLFLDREQTGVLQLVRLMLVAKYAYFNMSIGVLGGIAFGLYLKDHRLDEMDSLRLLSGGLLLFLVGLALLYSGEGSLTPLFENGDDMGLWRWSLYIGVVLMLTTYLKKLASDYESHSSTMRSIMNWGSVVGQCTLVIFVLHGMILSLKALLDATGLPDIASLSLSLALFFAICGWTMRKIHHLYYS